MTSQIFRKLITGLDSCKAFYQKESHITEIRTRTHLILMYYLILHFVTLPNPDLVLILYEVLNLHLPFKILRTGVVSGFLIIVLGKTSHSNNSATIKIDSSYNFSYKYWYKAYYLDFNHKFYFWMLICLASVLFILLTRLIFKFLYIPYIHKLCFPNKNCSALKWNECLCFICL